jgi:hypothetical protein
MFCVQLQFANASGSNHRAYSLSSTITWTAGRRPTVASQLPGVGVRPSVIEFSWAKERRRDPVQIAAATDVERTVVPNPAFVQAVIRAHSWIKLLTDGTYNSIESLAKAIDLHPKVI